MEVKFYEEQFLVNEDRGLTTPLFLNMSPHQSLESKIRHYAKLPIRHSGFEIEKNAPDQRESGTSK